MRAIGWVAAGLLVAHALVITAFWGELGAAFSNDGLSYAQRRIRYAFNGLPVDRLASNLDAALGPDRASAIALSPRLQGNDFVRQRLSEGLYPRRVDHSSAHQLDFEPHAGFALDGKPFDRKGTQLDSPSTENGAQDALAYLVTLAALMGLGFGGLVLLRKKMDFAAAPLLAACAIALWTSFASWTQISLSLRVPLLFGLASFVALGALASRYRPLDQLKKIRPKPELWVFCFLLALFLIRATCFPLTLWDGRSIWLFHAKQIVTNGMLPKADIVQPDYLWSHPDYPLLFPSWIAFFMAATGRLGERAGALGVATFNIALALLLWSKARASIGRWPGAAVTLAIFLYLFHAIAGAYADPALTMLLLIEFFCFLPEGDNAIGWTAALAASMIKTEGLVLAGLVAIAFLIRTRKKRDLPLLLCFLPAVLHKAWASSLGVESILKGSSASAALERAPERFFTAIGSIPSLFVEQGYTDIRQILWPAALALLLALGLWAAKRSIPQTAKIAIVLAAAMIAFAPLSISFLPEDINWFVQTALDRLLVHPAALLLIAPFAWLAQAQTGTAHAAKKR